MDVQLTWTDCDKAGDYVVPNVLSPRGLVSRPDSMDETVSHQGHVSTVNYLITLVLGKPPGRSLPVSSAHSFASH